MIEPVSVVSAALEEALKLASNGIKVFPLYRVVDGVCNCKKGNSCDSPGKHPAVGNRPWEKATDDTKEVRKLFEGKERNVGILAGEDNGIFMLDFDGEAGMRTLEEWRARGLPPTWEVKTGSGGLHLIYAIPWNLDFEIRNTVKSIGSGVDGRGEHGYTAGPGSVTNKGDYSWVYFEDDPANPPTWLIELMRAAVVNTKQKVNDYGIEVEVDWNVEPTWLNEKIGMLMNSNNQFADIMLGNLKHTDDSRRDFALYKDMLRAGFTYQEATDWVVSIRRSSGGKLHGDYWFPMTIANALAELEKEKAEKEALSAFVESSATVQESLSYHLPNDLRVPPNYEIYQHGVFHTTFKGSTPQVKCICPVPLYISRRLRNIDTGDEKIEISFYRDGRCNTLTVARSIVFNNSHIITLANSGLPVSSDNAKGVVKYLAQFEKANLDMSPHSSVERMGWIGDEFNEFLPALCEGVQLDAPSNLTRGYRAKGTLEGWIKIVQPILKHPIARFILASSFASPLLKMVDERSFIVYAYGATRGGKTSSVKTALSVWGHPDDLLISFNNTSNYIEGRASFNHHLPIGLDERQSVKDQTFVEQLVYRLANGQSRGRMDRSGNLRDQVTWQTITIATGEDALTVDNTRGGVISRAIEIYGRPIADTTYAKSLHRLLNRHHGHAGPEFMRQIMAIHKESADTLTTLMDFIEEELSKKCPHNVETHLSATALVCMADYYMHTFLFGKSESEALDGSIELGGSILHALDHKGDTDDAKRAYEDFMSWFAVNRNYFTAFSKEEYGWINNPKKIDHVYIYPTTFKKCMAELGFNEKRIKKEWAERGWIKTEERGKEGKLRYNVREWHSQKGTQTVVAVKVDSVDS